MISMSLALANYMLDEGPFREAMNNCLLKVYSGTAPVNPDASRPAAEAALGDAVLLCTYSDAGSGTGLTWEAEAENNVLSKTASQVWSGVAVADGMASFFRIVLEGDDGTASTEALRLQGAVGQLTGDMLVSVPLFTTGETRTITSFYTGLMAG